MREITIIFGNLVTLDLPKNGNNLEASVDTPMRMMTMMLLKMMTGILLMTTTGKDWVTLTALTILHACRNLPLAQIEAGEDTTE